MCHVGLGRRVSTLQTRAGLHMYVSRGDAHADSVGGLRVFYAPPLEGRGIAARRPCRGGRGGDAQRKGVIGECERVGRSGGPSSPTAVGLALAK